MTLEGFLVLAGAFAGGLVNGLTGFGTAQTALPFLLQALQPAPAAMLAAALSVAGHVQTLPAIWRHINWPRTLPLICGGLLGVPIGIVLLPHVPLATFKLAVGLVVAGYSAYTLLGGLGWQLHRAGPVADAAVGLGGGVMGGLAALSGILPVVWAGLQGWTKDERRGVFQAFNAAVLVTTLLAGAAAGLMTREVLTALAAALPASVLGTFIGLRLYRRLDDRRFDRLVLLLLLVAGLALVVSSQPLRVS
jgi:hypothetical protein